MQRLLRGIIDFDGDPERLRPNFLRLREAVQRDSLAWIHPVDSRIYNFCEAFWNEQLTVPAITSLRTFLESESDIEAGERLKDIESAPFFNGANYDYILTQIVERQRQDRICLVVDKVKKIAREGVTVKDGRKEVKVKGADAALTFISSQLPTLYAANTNAVTQGDLTDHHHVKAALDKYLDAEAGAGVVGALSGIGPIDNVCGGLKRGELWIHAGYAGEMKTSFALNWAYHQVTTGKNVLYVSLEMPFEQCGRLVYVLHSSHGKFRDEGKTSLDYRKVRDGKLGEAKIFYHEVLSDFTANSGYGRFYVWAPERKVTINDIRVQAEQLQREFDLAMVVIDHGGLVEPPKSASRDDYIVRANTIARDAKLLALHFDRGKGIPVLLLWQMNREGKKEAAKDQGKFRLHALGWANEAERSADVVTSSYLDDDLRAAGQVVLGNLKNRDNQLFDLLRLNVDWRCRRMWYDAANRSPDITDDDHDEVMHLLQTAV